MILWKQLRVPLLAATLGGVLLILGKSVFDPTVGSPSSFAFSPAVPLPGWQLLASSPLAAKTVNQPDLLAGRRYQYIQSGLLLDIEMRYLVSTDGDVKTFVQGYTSPPSSSNNLAQILRQREQAGLYSLFVHQKRAYLSTCINPRGGSTVTHEQFMQNRSTYDMRFSRLLPWLLGQEDLRDLRCLWAHLSIPLNRASPEHAYQVLENAWFSWYQWWSPRFPKR